MCFDVSVSCGAASDKEMCLTDGEASGNDEPDVTDECAMLLRTDALLKPVQVMHKTGGMRLHKRHLTPTRTNQFSVHLLACF